MVKSTCYIVKRRTFVKNKIPLYLTHLPVYTCNFLPCIQRHSNYPETYIGYKWILSSTKDWNKQHRIFDIPLTWKNYKKKSFRIRMLSRWTASSRCRVTARPVPDCRTRPSTASPTRSLTKRWPRNAGPPYPSPGRPLSPSSSWCCQWVLEHILFTDGLWRARIFCDLCDLLS